MAARLLSALVVTGSTDLVSLPQANKSVVVTGSIVTLPQTDESVQLPLLFVHVGKAGGAQTCSTMMGTKPTADGRLDRVMPHNAPEAERLKRRGGSHIIGRGPATSCYHLPLPSQVHSSAHGCNKRTYPTM
jgi:hypothetical protein